MKCLSPRSTIYIVYKQPDERKRWREWESERETIHELDGCGSIAAFDDFDDQVRASFDTRNASDTLN